MASGAKGIPGKDWSGPASAGKGREGDPSPGKGSKTGEKHGK